jgi:hypothetical protein
MFRRSSDLAERQPIYDDIMLTAQRAIDDGAFEGLDPAIPRLFEGAIPTGLKRNNMLDVPRNYDPGDGPLVLVVRPGEDVTCTAARVVTRSTQRIATNAGFHALASLKPPGADMERQIPESNGVYFVDVPWDDKGLPQPTLHVPVVLQLHTGLLNEVGIPSTVGHELDHWDFLLHPTISYNRAEPEIPKNLLLTTMERRAYASSYQIEQNMRQHQNMPSPAELAESCRADDPEEAGRIIRSTFMDAVKKHIDLLLYPHSLAAVAITHLFADSESGQVTAAEIAAYKAAEYI